MEKEGIFRPQTRMVSHNALMRYRLGDIGTTIDGQSGIVVSTFDSLDRDGFNLLATLCMNRSTEENCNICERKDECKYPINSEHPYISPYK